MSNFTSDLQGMFTATGNNINLSIRSGVDRMNVYNLSQANGGQTSAVGIRYYWQAGMAPNAKWVVFATNAAAATNLEQYITSAGFTLIDSSLQTPGVLVSTITAVSADAIPVVTNTGTNGLAAGSVVRLINVAGAQQLGGMDFTVGYNTLSTTTFDLSYMAQIVAGTTGSWRNINFNPIFYPRRRSITAVSSSGATTVVTMSVTHGYQVGQQVRFIVPAAFGMTQLNNLTGNIIAISDVTDGTVNSITVDIDSSAFTTFVFPLSAKVPFSPAEVVPVGENTAVALAANVAYDTDSTINRAYLGIQLTGGVSCPGGAADDVMMWQTSTTDLNDLTGQLVLSN